MRLFKDSFENGSFDNKDILQSSIRMSKPIIYNLEEKKEDTRSVLEFFHKNIHLLNKFFINIIKFAQEVGLSNLIIEKEMRDAYIMCQHEVKSLAVLDVFVVNRDTASYEDQIKTDFLVIFFCKIELDKINKNGDLFKILFNSFYKYKETFLVANKTYELFLEYCNCSSFEISKKTYEKFIDVFVSTIVESNEFYKEDKLNLNFAVKELNINECIDKIIEDKSYKNYETDKLVLSVLYEKTSSFSNIEEFLSEYDRLEYYIMKVKKASLKEDLLNNEYQNKKTSIVDIDLMSGIEFEEFLCNYFKNHGYECSMTKASADQGVDLIAKRDGTVVAIQAKCYSGTVGNHAIMEAVAGARFYNANQCMVITNSTFTKTAIELARANNVILWDRKTLIEKI